MDKGNKLLYDGVVLFDTPIKITMTARKLSKSSVFSMNVRCGSAMTCLYGRCRDILPI